MAKFYFTNKAVSDLADIWNYTSETWSEKQAENYYMLLIGSCKELAIKPNMGRKYSQISSDIYGFVAYQHLIFYRILSKKEIEIVRILHGRMDLNNKI